MNGLKRIGEHFLRAFSKGHYATLTGRSTRAEFWSFFGVYVVLSFLINALATVMIMALGSSAFWAVWAAGLVWTFLTVVPMLTITVRRFRDAGFSPWWVAALTVGQFALQGWLNVATSEGATLVIAVLSLAALLFWLYVLCHASVAERRE